MGALFKDRVGVSDTVSATLETEVLAPVYPCGGCGAETKPRAETPVADSAARRCWSCKYVASDIVESHARDTARFPCPNKVERGGMVVVCGKEMKLYKTAVQPAPARVCVNTKCDHVTKAS